MKLNAFRILFAFGVIALLVAFAYAKNNSSGPLVSVTRPSPTPSPTPSASDITNENTKVENISGEITSTQQNTNVITLLKVKLTNTESPISVNVDSKTVITDEYDAKILPQNLQIGFTIAISGVPDVGALKATEIKVIKSPNIITMSPENNQTVGKLFKISGIGRVFENNMHVRLTNKRNKEIYVNATVMTEAKDVGLYGPFTVNVDLSQAKDLKAGDSLTVEALQFSAKDGTETDVATVTLLYNQ